MDLTSRLQVLRRRSEELAEDIHRLEDEIAESTSRPEGVVPAARAVGAIASYLALAPNTDRDQLLQTILRCAMHTTRAGGAGLTLFDEKRQKLVFHAAIGDGSDGILGYEVPLEGSAHGLAFATGEVQASTPIHREVEEATGVAFRNVLVAPLVTEGEPVGTISAVNKQGADGFTVEDMEAYQRFSDLAALVVRQRLREQVLLEYFEGDGKTPEQMEDIRLTDREKRIVRIASQLTQLAAGRELPLALVEQLFEVLERHAE
jgi:GAF domain-containing protein